MVLAFYGVEKPESELRQLFRTKARGTHVANVMIYLPTIGFSATVTDGSLQDLKRLIARTKPPVVHVWTESLAYWHPQVAMHAVVVVGLDEAFVYVNDPAFAEAPHQVPIEEFLAAWSAADSLMIQIDKVREHKG
jgi:ABC-type bacteriocin/lantibiotic exporter with double-glycine peptidase domain